MNAILITFFFIVLAGIVTWLITHTGLLKPVEDKIKQEVQT